MDHLLEAIEFGDLFRLNLKNQIENFRNLEEEEEEELMGTAEHHVKESISIVIFYSVAFLMI